MKSVALVDRGQFKAVAVLKQIIRTPALNAGINYDEMHKRCRILSALDAAEKAGAERLDLEDADHNTLVAALKAFPFGVADLDLLAILDEIKNAKAPEASV